MIELLPLNDERTHWLRSTYPRFIEELVTLGGRYTRDINGVWQPDYLPYWLDASQPVLVRVIADEDQSVGFLLAGRDAFPYKSADCDYHLSEFYLIPEARRRGFGGRAAQALWAAHPGCWELAVLHANKPALQFWRALLADRAEETVGEVDVRFRFDSR